MQRTKLILLITLWVVSTQMFFACPSMDVGAASSEARVTFTAEDVVPHTVDFSPDEVTVARGETLMLTTTNSALEGLSGWEWYVDNEQEVSQTSSSFVWETGGKQPGQYIISVAVVHEGVKYSGSLRVTVIY